MNLFRLCLGLKMVVKAQNKNLYWIDCGFLNSYVVFTFNYYALHLKKHSENVDTTEAYDLSVRAEKEFWHSGYPST